MFWVFLSSSPLILILYFLIQTQSRLREFLAFLLVFSVFQTFTLLRFFLSCEPPFFQGFDGLLVIAPLLYCLLIFFSAVFLRPFSPRFTFRDPPSLPLLSPNVVFLGSPVSLIVKFSVGGWYLSQFAGDTLCFLLFPCLWCFFFVLRIANFHRECCNERLCYQIPPFFEPLQEFSSYPGSRTKNVPLSLLLHFFLRIPPFILPLKSLAPPILRNPVPTSFPPFHTFVVCLFLFFLILPFGGPHRDRFLPGP